MKVFVCYASMSIVYHKFLIFTYYLFYSIGKSKNQPQITRFQLLDIPLVFPFFESTFRRIILSSGLRYVIISKYQLLLNLQKKMFAYFAKNQIQHHLRLNGQHTHGRLLSMPLLILSLVMIKYVTNFFFLQYI